MLVKVSVPGMDGVVKYELRVHEIELPLLLIPVLVTVKSIGELLFFHTPYNPASSYTFLIYPCNHLVHSFQYRDYYY